MVENGETSKCERCGIEVQYVGGQFHVFCNDCRVDEFYKLKRIRNERDAQKFKDDLTNQTKQKERNRFRKLILEHKNCTKYHTIDGKEATCLDMILLKLNGDKK